MDGGDSDINISQEELAKLTPADHRELQTFIQNESQKATVQKSECYSGAVHLVLKIGS